MRKKNIMSFFIILFSIYSYGQTDTYTNPILPTGADPFSFYHNGFYYYTNTMYNEIKIWKTKNLAHLSDAESKTIFVPPKGKPFSEHLWAPEIHFIQGAWYLYFAADDGNNDNHRMYVMMNDSEDPFQGEWELKGKIAAKPDRWAIDGNVFEHADQLYMIWSGWEGNINGQQNIYIAKMTTPFTIDGIRVLISEPTQVWEKQGDLKNPPHVSVNEGPQFLEHQGKIFIVFSASHCSTDFYSLGLLELEGNDPLAPHAWKKYPYPIFTKSEENSVYAPGHNSFFKSPDGTEDWILYHANGNPEEGCGQKRSPRMQKFSWNEDGFPNFGIPKPAWVSIPLPSANN
ncbi:MAG: glycosyl hydrolase family 43 [Flavobacteriales bacterium 32-35-8]|nr:MAG: glycosyl hydrolase family 43 [Flavobacteriales bacterium 32-35-8]